MICRFLAPFGVAVVTLMGCETEPEVPNYLLAAASASECEPPTTFHVTLRWRDPTADCAALEPSFLGCMQNVDYPTVPPGEPVLHEFFSVSCTTREDGAVACARSFFVDPAKSRAFDEYEAGEHDEGAWKWLQNAVTRGLLPEARLRNRFTADEARCFPEYLRADGSPIL